MIAVIGGRYSGGEKYAAERFPDRRIVTGYESRIREQLCRGEDPVKCAAQFLDEAPEDLVLVLTEMGCGVIPAEKEERKFREENGRVNCFFAAEAEQVIRVIAGVGQRIK